MIDKGEPQAQPQQPAAQPVTNFQLASLVSKDVELVSILLKRADLESHVVREMSATQLSLAQQFRPRYELAGDPRRLLVHMGFVLDLNAPKDPPENILHLGAEYTLTYTLPEGGAEYPAMALDSFAELNGALNVWPYWRELVHTVVARVGLGSITLPVFRAKARPVEPQPEAAKTPNEGEGKRGG
ncbi:MAG: hypothetical protein WD773_09910 [Gemmatimonadales bacterium]